MNSSTQTIAVLCDYQLQPDRVGGMDHFFWMFDKQCRARGISVDWFFPNKAVHGDYNLLHIVVAKNHSIEQSFLNYSAKHDMYYTHVFTHFIELCTPFFKGLKKISKVRVIAVDHNPRPLDGYPLKKRIKKRIKGFMYGRYIDVFVGVSEHTKKMLLSDFGKHIKHKTQVVFNGLEVNKYLLKTDFTFNKKFIVASHLRKEKGIQDLLLAMRDLTPFDFRVDIYGKGHYENDLKTLVKTYGLKNHVCFKGSVPKLHDIYRAYDYLIHPSHGETFGYAVVEALLSGLPVITTKSQGNILGLIEHDKNGYLFDAKDIKGLTSPHFESAQTLFTQCSVRCREVNDAKISTRNYGV